ncbi:DNA-3-methyladenine glycosylase [Staphylococcus caeli]|uniref:Putative 3-methyladenine DNA glycosylase n=1 Tax=Staphylococcus caeli TaxID=2201815 RepID=A0A1D4K5J5_9STAP|nr:DNA-3-methyladenine glycosylase [Staphylococcus caeli]SCS69268.1 3-methylpurine glycosylase [Staphylococcus caeli]SCS79284.1 3-methylpurine glycosylase [Staphylococcus caeli]
MDFLQRDTITIAKDLLGVRVIYQDELQTFTGYIVETEAYIGKDDQAAHGYKGKRTPKVESLYKRGGTIYAHVMHTHLLINFVTQQEGQPEGVLIRAVEPEEGIESMQLNRGKSGISLTNGPGKWTKAFNIPRHLDGSRVNEGRLKIDTKHRKYPKSIEASSRIGIPNKGEWTYKPLRFTVKGNPYVSRMRKSDMLSPDATWRI